MNAPELTEVAEAAGLQTRTTAMTNRSHPSTDGATEIAMGASLAAAQDRTIRVALTLTTTHVIAVMRLAGPIATAMRVTVTSAPATCSCGISISRVDRSGKSSVTAPASTRYAVRNPARCRPSARFAWCPLVIFATATVRPIHAPATFAIFASRGSSRPFGCRGIVTTQSR